VKKRLEDLMVKILVIILVIGTLSLLG